MKLPYQLIYSSYATERMPKSKLYKILLVARLENARRDVTGLLVFAEDQFLQILEGEKEVVQDLMRKISSDKRHSDVKVVSESDVKTRAFPSWRMAYVSTNAKELATWAGLRNTTTIDDTLAHLKSAPSDVSVLLQKLMGSISEP